MGMALFFTSKGVAYREVPDHRPAYHIPNAVKSIWLWTDTQDISKPQFDVTTLHRTTANPKQPWIYEEENWYDDNSNDRSETGGA
jgi:hypothetical protein